MSQQLALKRKPNIVETRTFPRPEIANGSQIELRNFDEPELDPDLEIDVEELELGAGLKSSKPRNIVEKLELARIKRALDRGEKLSPSELSGLGTSASPEAKDLMDRSRALAQPKGFTLSPFRALIRSL